MRSVLEYCCGKFFVSKKLQDFYVVRRLMTAGLDRHANHQIIIKLTEDQITMKGKEKKNPYSNNNNKKIS